MTRVLIFQTDEEEVAALRNFFLERRDKVAATTNPKDALRVLTQGKPDLVLLDLHLPKGGCLAFLSRIQKENPDLKVIITTKFPDFQRELLVQKLGASVFLRQPFSAFWIERALERVFDENGAQASQTLLAPTPRIRMPVRMKITVPFVMLAIVFSMVAAYFVSQIVFESIEDRFTNQLIEVGKLTSDWLVQEEDRRLEILRLLAHTEGLADALIAGDAESLRELALPIVVNARGEVVDFLAVDGVSVLSLRHREGGELEDYDALRGERVFGDWNFVQRVLNQEIDAQGDKFAGNVQTEWGDYTYVAGPVYDNEGRLAGAILVGDSLLTLVRGTRAGLLGRDTTLAHVSIYDLSGQPLASTFLQWDALALTPEEGVQLAEMTAEQSLLRPITVASIDYAEILAPMELRGVTGHGVIGASLAKQFLIRPTQATRIQIFLLITLAFLLVVSIGVFVAGRITRPLERVIDAANQVSQGNLEVYVEPNGTDELAYLTTSFNYMVSNLREGAVYRDLLGRVITPQVREQLRQNLASGNLRLEGQNVVATVMITDIRSFTPIAENAPPATILSWLNEYFGEVVPAIKSCDGIVNEIYGDSTIAFFGVLPTPMDPKISAYNACRAGLEVVRRVEKMNATRVARGEPPFITGIGINTGMVAVGGLGAEDRLHFSIIGDTVNVTSRMEGVTREFGETSIVISHPTYVALGQRREEFHFEPAGAHLFKGKTHPIRVYRMKSTD